MENKHMPVYVVPADLNYYLVKGNMPMMVAANGTIGVVSDFTTPKGQTVQVRFIRRYVDVQLKLPIFRETAQKINRKYKNSLRIDGYAGGTEPGGGVWNYHVDSPEALGKLMQIIYALFGPAIKSESCGALCPDQDATLRQVALTAEPLIKASHGEELLQKVVQLAKERSCPYPSVLDRSAQSVLFKALELTNGNEEKYSYERLRILRALVVLEDSELANGFDGFKLGSGPYREGQSPKFLTDVRCLLMAGLRVRRSITSMSSYLPPGEQAVKVMPPVRNFSIAGIAPVGPISVKRREIDGYAPLSARADEAILSASQMLMAIIDTEITKEKNEIEESLEARRTGQADWRGVEFGISQLVTLYLLAATATRELELPDESRNYLSLAREQFELLPDGYRQYVRESVVESWCLARIG